MKALMGSITIQAFLEKNNNQRYGCSVCEFCGEVACYVNIFEAELGHGCDEQNIVWRDAATFVDIPIEELKLMVKNNE